VAHRSRVVLLVESLRVPGEPDRAGAEILRLRPLHRLCTPHRRYETRSLPQPPGPGVNSCDRTWDRLYRRFRLRTSPKSSVALNGARTIPVSTDGRRDEPTRDRSCESEFLLEGPHFKLQCPRTAILM